MRDLCQTHKLVLAEDGKCVLCRRPPTRLFAVREEHETLISRIFTGLLGACLAAAAAALIYASQLGGGYEGGRYVAGPVSVGQLSARQKQQLKEALAEDQQAGAADAGAAAGSEQAAAPAADEVDAKPAQAAQAKADTGKPAAKPAPASAPQQPPAALAPVKVTMYATPWCDICDRARDFLLARNVVLTEFDIDRDKEAERRLTKSNPSASVPTFEIAGRAYIGFNPWDLEDALRDAAAQTYSARAR